MGKIEKLTAEQEQALVAYHAECMAIGTSTAPADRPRAEAAISKMYQLIGKPQPTFVWCDSPATCILARFVLQEWSKTAKEGNSLETSLRTSLRTSLETSLRTSLRASLGTSLETSLWTSLGTSLETSLGASLGTSLWTSLRTSLWTSLRTSLGTSLRASLETSLGTSLRASLWTSLRTSLETSLGTSLRTSLETSLGTSLETSLGTSNWGQQEQYWIGFYRFMELHLKIAYDPQKSGHLGWWNDIAESANWWFPYEGYCFVSERPVRCAIDEERRLHHESLAAMEFKDGWKVYAYHGVTVPAQVIETPETITIEQIKNEENAEVRRCMVERMGWARFYSEAGMKVLHEDTLESNFPSIPISELVSESARLVTSYRPGTETAQLLEAEGIRDYEDRPLRFVRLTDPSTGRQYTLRVLHSHTRCYEAVGWSFGKTEEEYKRGKYVRHGDVGLFPLSGGPTAQTHS